MITFQPLNVELCDVVHGSPWPQAGWHEIEVLQTSACTCQFNLQSNPHCTWLFLADGTAAFEVVQALHDRIMTAGKGWALGCIFDKIRVNLCARFSPGLFPSIVPAIVHSICIKAGATDLQLPDSTSSLLYTELLMVTCVSMQHQTRPDCKSTASFRPIKVQDFFDARL